MEKTSLDAYRKVQPDKRLVIVPPLSWEDREMLSRQTGFNRTLLESSGECGCFYCGRRFPTNLISNWLVEPGEEDTGCCPYCGKDTLIVGTEGFPLSTALLTSLYMDWFASEYERNKHYAFEIPLFKNHLDYLSKGVPFRWKISAPQRPSVEIPAWSLTVSVILASEAYIRLRRFRSGRLATSATGTSTVRALRNPGYIPTFLLEGNGVCAYGKRRLMVSRQKRKPGILMMKLHGTE